MEIDGIRYLVLRAAPFERDADISAEIFSRFAPPKNSRLFVFGRLRVEPLFEDIYERHDVTNYDVLPSGEELVMIRARAR